ncbi:MAG: hypothetical protein A4E52_02227 [Pelotomaculum sp. PtaB.Bin013]|nr:MAG: hypothetical protein A4E52_02227 [Pelotomaculum sp. PtaB.Bin013]
MTLTVFKKYNKITPYQRKKLYMYIWTVGWLIALIGFTPLLIVLLNGVNISLIRIHLILIYYATLIFLLWGNYGFHDRRMPRFWVYAALITGLWDVSGTLLQFPFLLTSIPSVSFQTAMIVQCGLLFLSNKETGGTAKYITGWSFILWGFHRFDYLFLHSNTSFLPWGYLIGTIKASETCLLVTLHSIRHTCAEEENERKCRSMENCFTTGTFIA